MIRAHVLQEVRQMRVEALYERQQQRIFTMAEAGEMPGVTERTFRRWSGHYHAEGAGGAESTDRRRSARAGPIDEATSERYSAFFLEEEGPLSSRRGRQEVIRTQGRLSALSAARGAHSWYTEATGGNGDAGRLTQVPRTRQQRGRTLIPASSPETRGRSARAVRTVPDRLPHERALAGLTERVAANRYLTEQVLPQHNKRVRATEPGPACIARVGTSLAEGLGVQDERVVATGNR